MEATGQADWEDTAERARVQPHDAGAGAPAYQPQPQPLPHPQVPGIARLLAAGVGGAGTNALNRMIEAGVSGVEYLAMNTDAQALGAARATHRLRLGETLTRGLGAGGNPEVGRKAAEESAPAIREALTGADMVFITAGMGGGTGTGASPLVAQVAREVGALAVAVVSTPFAFERRRRLIAEQGIATLREMVDAMIVVPNERLIKLAGQNMSAFEAYRVADDVLRQGIQGISDLITVPGLINLDFADVQAVMTDAGSALMSIGQASGEKRAEEAARAAITNSLLDVDISGARGVIFNVTGGDDLTMAEVSTIADIISGAAHADATIIFGTVYAPNSDGVLKVTVVATGFEPRVAMDPQRALRPRAAVVPASPAPLPASAANRALTGTPAEASPAPAAGMRGRQPTAIGHDGSVAQTQKPRMDEVVRVVAQAPQHRPERPREDGAVARPDASQSRSPLRGGYHGDEFLANDEPEEAEVPQAPRSPWEQLFGRR
jgi:cell division protein FtsZ